MTHQNTKNHLLQRNSSCTSAIEQNWIDMIHINAELFLNFNIGSGLHCHGGTAQEAARRYAAAASDGGGSAYQGERPAAAGGDRCHNGR